MNGGSGQAAVNFNKWIGFVMDLGAVHNGNIGGNHLDSTLTNYLFGPRVSLRYSRFTPYFNVWLGGVHASNSIAVSAIPIAAQPLPGYPTVTPGQPVTLRAVASQTAFAWGVGGGLDIRITKVVSFRPVGLDYLMTRLQNYRSLDDNNQHNLRYTTGINFTFGAR
jgi:opacity protein-like surface antigen